MPQTKPNGQFLLCVKNEGYLASLEVRKVYQALPDPVAASRGFVRVIDKWARITSTRPSCSWRSSYPRPQPACLLGRRDADP